jgi:hypothetical protein
MFGRVKPGSPWWYWMKNNTNENVEVRKIIKDGSGNLWTEVAGHGVKVEDLLKTHTCMGPISEDIGDAQ